VTEKPLVRRCMRDQVRDVLLERILEGTYAPGHRLIELELAAEFQISQSPVREALRELEAMGVVESQRYCGTRVRASDVREMQEAYELRAILEQNCAQLAVPLSAQTLAALESDLQDMQMSAAMQDVMCYSQAARSFHRHIVVESGNRLILQIWDNVQVRARLPFVAHYLVEELREFAAVHEPILRYLRNGDGVAAGDALRAMMQGLSSRMALLTTSHQVDSPEGEQAR
jgi:Transcriptional regulators